MFQVTLLSLCHVTYNLRNFQQMELGLDMIVWSLLYFLDHLRMTSILLAVNMYCRFFSISKLGNWGISEELKIYSCRLDYVFSFDVKVDHMAFLCLLFLAYHLYLHECSKLLFHSNPSNVLFIV